MAPVENAVAKAAVALSSRVHLINILDRDVIPGGAGFRRDRSMRVPLRTNPTVAIKVVRSRLANPRMAEMHLIMEANLTRSGITGRSNMLIKWNAPMRPKSTPA